MTFICRFQNLSQIEISQNVIQMMKFSDEETKVLPFWSTGDIWLSSAWALAKTMLTASLSLLDAVDIFSIEREILEHFRGVAELERQR